MIRPVVVSGQAHTAMRCSQKVAAGRLPSSQHTDAVVAPTREISATQGLGGVIVLV